jgi:hypothetical protein
MVEKLDGVEAGAQKNPDLSGYAKKTDIPVVPDLTDYAKTADVLPRYPFVEADWVEDYADIDIDNGKATFLFVKKYHNSHYDTSSSKLQHLFIVSPEGKTSDGLMRDAVLVIDMPEGSEPSVSWFMDVYPRGGDAANLEVVAGKRNVFFITEVQPNQFMVARDELALPDEGGGE